MSPEEVLAIATVALVLVTVVLVVLQTRMSHKDLRVRTHLTMEDRFDNETMKGKRAKLAEQLMAGAHHDEIQEDVPNFFETLAVLGRKKMLDKDLFSSTWSFYASRWWTALKPYIQEERRLLGEDIESGTFFDQFQHMATELYQNERGPTTIELNKFLQDEKALTSKP